MRSTSELNHLFDTQYRCIRMMNCIGCNLDKPSQKHHMTCLTDFDRDFYIMKTLAFMSNRKLIDKDEFKYLNETYTITMDEPTYKFLDSMKSIELIESYQNYHSEYKDTSSL